ncbi:MAG: hypothetical protein KC766_22990, partial [Myxococcales bacterium]|nr:hypothetical protein [Myxococcales bacterium]
MDSVTTRAKPPAGWFERRRQLVALLGAGVLHGAAWLASVALSPPEAARVVEQRAVAADEVAIELELLEQPQTGTHQESAAAPAPVIQRLAKASRFSGAAARRVDDPVTGEPKEGNGPAWEASAAKPETDEHDPKAPRRRLSLTDLGGGNSRAHWRIPSGEPGAQSTRAARKRIRKKKIEERIEKEMAKKGLECDVQRGIATG